MAYPFAGFGSFLFRDSERPMVDTDTSWAVKPTIARSRPLGSATDNIRTMAIGSAERSFELRMDEDRYATLQALINTVGAFTDWTRPTPDSRQAYLANATIVAHVASISRTGKGHRKYRVRVELISQ